MAFDVTKIFRDPPRTNTDEAYLSQYEIDRKSVFVGNIPHDITEDQLRQVFENSGDVVQVQVIQRVFGTIAYVEFSRPDMPDIAIRQCVSFSLLPSLYTVTNTRHLTAWEEDPWCASIPPCREKERQKPSPPPHQLHLYA
jgi:hypothetical protein